MIASGCICLGPTTFTVRHMSDLQSGKDYTDSIDKDELPKAKKGSRQYSDLAITNQDAFAKEKLKDTEKEMEKEDSFSDLLVKRVQVTAEVAVSKIFPAGFGWQTAATMADSAGMQATDVSFYLTTGFGDGFGVFAGHTAYMMAKKAIVDPTIDTVSQAQVGILLGSAACCSGGVWQPTVNALQAAGWGFNESLAFTVGACGLAFFTGLRGGRLVYGRALGFRGVEENGYCNLKADAALSIAVGGACGTFVGTDVSYGSANWLSSLVGVEETCAATTASMLAGSSTALGFTVVQMGENVAYPRNKCWLD